MIRRRPLLAAAVLAGAVSLLGAAPPGHVDVAMRTSLGTIVVRLDAAHAPGTVRNFLHYVDTRAYDGASFYRSVRPNAQAPSPSIQIVQGGLERSGRTASAPPVPIEPTTKTGLHNAPATIAMARTSDPNSATSEFFINVADDRFLDAQNFADHAGYAVFGTVIRGMDVVRKIQQAPAQDNAMGEAIVPPIRILSVRRVR